MSVAPQSLRETDARDRRGSRQRSESPQPPVRRRRISKWDSQDYQFGVPNPPSEAHVSTDHAKSPMSSPPTPPRSMEKLETVPSVCASTAVTTPAVSRSTAGMYAIVGPPRTGETGPLAGIDISALRALICPPGMVLVPVVAAQASSGLVATPRNDTAPEEASVYSTVPPVPSESPSFSRQHRNSPIQAGTPLQATRHARRLYVGNLPVNTSDMEVADFFNRALIHAKGVEAPGNPVVSVYLNLEKRFAFIELRSLREAAAALAMDGVLFRSMSLRMRRPNDYNEAACPPANPPEGFDPSLLGIVSTQVGDGPNKVFIGGIPYGLNEDAIKELLQTYGRLAAFNLIKDPSTGLSKGFAFFEYVDSSVIDLACTNLTGTTIGDKVLTVRRATQQGPHAGGGSNAGLAGVGLNGNTTVSLGNSTLASMGLHPSPKPAVTAAMLVRQPSRIVQLRNVVTENELRDDAEYADVVEETEEEARRFGALERIVVPRPGPEGEPEVKGVGLVFLIFEKQDDAERAFAFMDGRKFEDRRVEATYIAEDVFNNETY